MRSRSAWPQGRPRLPPVPGISLRRSRYPLGLSGSSSFLMITLTRRTRQRTMLEKKVSSGRLASSVAAGIEIFVARIPDRKDSNAVLCDEGPEGGVDGLRRIIQRRAPYSAPNLEDQVSNAIKKNRRLAQAVFDDEVEIILDKRYLVKRLIEPGTLCALYGPSTVGKTFLALDLAAHIAHGKPLAERPTERAPVLYCALEGAAGVDRRMAAIVTAMGASDRQTCSLRRLPHLRYGSERIELRECAY